MLRTETMFDDVKHISSLIGQDSNSIGDVRLNVVTSENSKSSTSKLLPILSELSSKSLQDLIDNYSLDMKLFGYEFDVSTFKASCEIHIGRDHYCC